MRSWTDLDRRKLWTLELMNDWFGQGPWPLTFSAGPQRTPLQIPQPPRSPYHSSPSCCRRYRLSYSSSACLCACASCASSSAVKTTQDTRSNQGDTHNVREWCFWHSQPPKCCHRDTFEQGFRAYLFVLLVLVLLFGFVLLLALLLVLLLPCRGGQGLLAICRWIERKKESERPVPSLWFLPIHQHHWGSTDMATDCSNSYIEHLAKKKTPNMTHFSNY